jgi:hypothetical protein
MITTILQIQDSAVKANKIGSIYTITNDLWFWISILEFTILLFLLFIKNNKNKSVKYDENILTEYKKTDIDMGNVVNSMYQSRALYDKLKVKCHPDRFSNSELNKTADELFKEITKHQRNYNKLLELKVIAENKLNIKI